MNRKVIGNDLNTVLGYLEKTPDGKIILSGIDEGITVNQPYGPLNNLAEMRSDFPHVEIIPRLKSSISYVPADQVVEIAIPNEAQFCVIKSSANIIASFEGRAQKPILNETLNGSFIVSPSDETKYYCAGSRILSLKEMTGAVVYASVMYYVTDKLVNV